MKIFNWLQRRFNHGTLKEGLAQSVERAEEFASGEDEQALLKQVALVDVLQGWKDGILTIGTLGFDPVTISNQQNGYFILGSESEKQIEVEHNKEDDEPEKHVSLESIKDRDMDKDLNCDGNDQVRVEDDEEVSPLISARSNNLHVIGANSNIPEINHDQKKIKGGERVTLAQLFLAESNDMAKEKKNFGGEDQPVFPGKKTSVRSKEGVSFAKKLTARGREDLRPIKKFNRMMKKMLKRKIHPELGGKGYKMEDQSKPNKKA